MISTPRAPSPLSITIEPGQSHAFQSEAVVEILDADIATPNMLRKGQVKRLDGRDSVGQAKFVASLFGMAA